MMHDSYIVLQIIPLIPPVVVWTIAIGLAVGYWERYPKVVTVKRSLGAHDGCRRWCVAPTV